MCHPGRNKRDASWFETSCHLVGAVAARRGLSAGRPPAAPKKAAALRACPESLQGDPVAIGDPNGSPAGDGADQQHSVRERLSFVKAAAMVDELLHVPMSEGLLEAIERGNAVALLPRLRG